MRPAKHGRPSPAAGRRSAVAAAIPLSGLEDALIPLSGLEDALFPFVQVTGPYAWDGTRTAGPRCRRGEGPVVAEADLGTGRSGPKSFAL